MDNKSGNKAGNNNPGKLDESGTNFRGSVTNNKTEPHALSTGLSGTLGRGIPFSVPCHVKSCIAAEPRLCPYNPENPGNVTFNVLDPETGEGFIKPPAPCRLLIDVQAAHVANINAYKWISGDEGGPDRIIVEQLAAALTIQSYCVLMINKSGDSFGEKTKDGVLKKGSEGKSGLGSALGAVKSTAARLYEKYVEMSIRIERLCGKLGLDPASRKKLGVDLGAGADAGGKESIEVFAGGGAAGDGD